MPSNNPRDKIKVLLYAILAEFSPTMDAITSQRGKSRSREDDASALPHGSRWLIRVPTLPLGDMNKSVWNGVVDEALCKTPAYVQILCN
jgi:hypothetical protein